MTRMVQPCWLSPGSPADAFPDVGHALTEPNGLLAIGGDLSPDRLVYAYRHGIFPWYSDGQPILWWSPNPRAVLDPSALKISRSLKKTLQKGRYKTTMNAAFEAVVRACAGPRANADGTWITRDMFAAYGRLHQLGLARSVECWDEKNHLVGGLYGVSLGRLFCGESMFSHAPDTSKVALVHLCRLGYEMIDCQIPNPHLTSLGAVEIRREDFVLQLAQWTRPA